MILYQFCLIFLYSGQNLLGGGPKETPFRKISCTQQYSHTTGKTLLKLMILFWYCTRWNKLYLTEHLLKHSVNTQRVKQKRSNLL